VTKIKKKNLFFVNKDKLYKHNTTMNTYSPYMVALLPSNQLGWKSL